MHSISRSPGVIYKWSSLGTPKPRVPLGEKEAREDRNAGWKGQGAKKRIVEGYRKPARQRKGVKTTEEGQRVKDRDYETERERKRVRERN